MKKIIIFCLFCLTLSNKITDLYKTLNGKTPFEMYKPEENPFRDYTDEKIYKMLIHDKTLKSRKVGTVPEKPVTYPKHWDWRKEELCMIDMFDQSDDPIANSACDCYAWRYCKERHMDPRLSKGYVEVCNDFSDPDRIWRFFGNKGVVDTMCIMMKPFTCPTTCDGEMPITQKYYIESYGEGGGVEVLKQEIFEGGPVQVIFTVYTDFLEYKSGIYQHVSGEEEGDHAVILIGYGEENGTEYWIAQNNWGPAWGEDGYFRIKLEECGIDEHAWAGVPKIY